MIDKLKKNWPLILFAIVFFGPMLGKDLIAILIIIAAIFFIFKRVGNLNIKNINLSNLSKLKNMANPIDIEKLAKEKKFKHAFLTIVLLFFVVWLFFASIQIVDAGETGVYSLFGKVKDQELSSGFHLVIPLAKVTRMSIRTEEYTMSIVQGEGQRYGSDVITALTKEGLNVDLDMTVLYSLQEEKASDVYRELGLTYDEKIIRPTIRTSIRDIIAQYEAKDIYSEKREEAAGEIQEQLANELNERGINIESVLLRNVVLPPNLAKAIQEKLEAEQEAEKYDFILAKEKKEKERRVIEAEGRRDSQRIINESLSTNYLYFLYINELKDREGTIYVPTNPSTGMPLFRELGR
ncbi:prohibitin family protein [Candidatus Parcubacteria bacterium]|nr:prohibitin family protein [Candidatus Parcubacteria bacterium]